MAYDLDDQPTQILLAFIRETETGRSGRDAYDVMYGHKQITPKFSKLTLKQAIEQGRGWTIKHGSSAAGAYQFMNATLIDLQRQLKLTGKETLTPQVQDYLALTLLNRRGFQDFMSGKISTVEFAKRLAMEWASFPVLADTKGAHRQIKRGQSYYAGDGLNKALVSPAEIEVLLAKALSAIGGKTVPVETLPAPDAPKGGAGVKVLAIVCVVLAIAWFVVTRMGA